MATGAALIKRRDRIQSLLNGEAGFTVEGKDKEFYENQLEETLRMINEGEHCTVCGRQLTSEESKADGFGPECRAKALASVSGEVVPFLIGVTGYARSGKDTFAHGLIDQLGFKRIAFADALRRDFLVLDPILAYDPPTQGNVGLGLVRLSDALKMYSMDEIKQVYPEFRRLLQVYGTDVWRTIDDDVWIKRALNNVVADGTPGYVFTDMRFPNERVGVGYDLTVRIERPGVGAVNGHSSESHIAAMEVDTVVFNDGDMAQLADVATALVRSKMGNTDTIEVNE